MRIENENYYQVQIMNIISYNLQKCEEFANEKARKKCIERNN